MSPLVMGCRQLPVVDSRAGSRNTPYQGMITLTRPVFTPQDLQEVLRVRIEEAGSARAAAAALSLSAAYMLDVRHGRRPASRRLLTALGLELAIVPVEPTTGAAHVA